MELWLLIARANVPWNHFLLLWGILIGEMELAKQCVPVWIVIQSSSLNMKMEWRIVVLSSDYGDKHGGVLENVSSLPSIRFKNIIAYRWTKLTSNDNRTIEITEPVTPQRRGISRGCTLPLIMADIGKQVFWGAMHLEGYGCAFCYEQLSKDIFSGVGVLSTWQGSFLKSLLCFERVEVEVQEEAYECQICQGSQ